MQGKQDDDVPKNKNKER